MRCLTLILALSIVGAASAQPDRYNLGVHEDGTYCAEGPTVQVYPPEAVLVDGEIRYTDADDVLHVLECKGGAVSLEPTQWKKLPDDPHFVVPVDWAKGEDGDPEPRKKPLPEKANGTPVAVAVGGAGLTGVALAAWLRSKRAT